MEDLVPFHEEAQEVAETWRRAQGAVDNMSRKAVDETRKAIDQTYVRIRETSVAIKKMDGLLTNPIIGRVRSRAR